MQSLADFLGISDPAQPDKPASSGPAPKLSAKKFCQAVVDSEEFRSYIVNGLKTGDLPAAVVVRVLDTAWGKPKETVDLNASVVTRVVREIVTAPRPTDSDEDTTEVDKAGDVVH